MTFEIKNGDCFDIGQTVNGCSRFILLNGKWHYYIPDRINREYEYDQDSLTQLIQDNEFDEIKYLGNY